MLTSPQEYQRITLFDATPKRVDEVLSRLQENVEDRNRKIDSISVDCCFLDNVQLHKLMSSCTRYVTVLESLYLRGNGVDANGAQLMASFLRDPNCALKELDLRWNNIGDVGAEAIATALHTNRKLEKLLLSKNNIGDYGAESIANALENASPALQFLDLEENTIGATGICAFAPVLKNNTTLRSLLLEGNKHQDLCTHLEIVMAALADAMRLNITIIKISLPKQINNTKSPLSTIIPTCNKNITYWLSIIDQHVRRNVLLRMRTDLAQISTPQPNSKHNPTSDPTVLSLPNSAPLSNEKDTSTEKSEPPKLPKLPEINISKIREVIEKSEKQLYSQILQLQHTIHTSDIAAINQKYHATLQHQIEQERQKFENDKNKIQKKLEFTQTTIHKLEKNVQCSDLETKGLYGVINDVEQKNKDLQARVSLLEKQLRKRNKKIAKLSKNSQNIHYQNDQILHENSQDAQTVITSLQAINNHQLQQIQILKMEKESLITHSETQFHELQKKNQTLENMIEYRLKYLPFQNQKTLPPTSITTQNSPQLGPSPDYSSYASDSDIIELKKEILRVKRAVEEEKLCVVCQDAEKVMAFVPCGHKCACERCSVGLTACPLCRLPCSTKCRIYQ